MTKRRRRADSARGERRTQPSITSQSSEQPPGHGGLASPVAVVVDDEPANQDFLVRLLQQAQLESYGASSGTEAVKLAEEHARIGLLVIDNKLPDIDGIALIKKLNEMHPEARIIMATMLDERDLITQAFAHGCDVFLVKPHGFMELFKKLRALHAGGEDDLKGMIIDQYGLRPYRG